MEALAAEDPRRIGAYKLLARLGAGGMGQVYLARSERGRTVAVKLVRHELAEQEEFRNRFRQEVRAAERVSAQWTAPVLDADTEAAIPWVATGYVAGPSLQSVVAHDYGPLPERSVRILAGSLALALKNIHSAGLIHRDLKPSNVLVTIDGPRVIDFGIARALETVTDGGLTRTGAVVGSPGFMAPEQVRGERITQTSDIFCLGSVLAFAASGRLPFGTASSGVHALMFRIAEEEPDLSPLPEGLQDLVGACLIKDPSGRPTLDTILARTGADNTLGDGRTREPWLPAALVAQLGREAVQLLETEEPDRPDATGTARNDSGRNGSERARQGAAGAAAGGAALGAGAGAAAGRRYRDAADPQEEAAEQVRAASGTHGEEAAQEPRGDSGAPPPPGTPAGGQGQNQGRGNAHSQPPPQPQPQPQPQGLNHLPTMAAGPAAGARSGSGAGQAPGPTPQPDHQPVYGYPQPYGAVPQRQGQGAGQGQNMGQGQGAGQNLNQPPQQGHPYGYPQPAAPPYGATPPYGGTPPHGGPPYGQGQTGPGGRQPQRSGRSTAALIAVALVVALGAGGSVYALMREGGDEPGSGHSSSAASSSQGSETPTTTGESESGSTEGDKNANDTDNTSTGGDVPDKFVGSWRSTLEVSGGTQELRMTITQGSTGDTVMTLADSGPAYDCRWTARLNGGDDTLELSPSDLTQGEKPQCSPGKTSRLQLTDPNTLVRQQVGSTKAPVTYTKE
ncbi:serine/threonine-protein kinase [Streptomyces tsukubensis]|uniref:Protein kinase domain-containing protein n=1 Tax=Streptomyces tsukubensis TaxID=83656 RepID=A0A1V4A3K4_9ACTN|nr:serine/threonine-protein kinase [Streptomyces tsukubensis]OON74881.1 hypothetical protein B1H18_23920 [Streptomyces tsukubensis]